MGESDAPDTKEMLSALNHNFAPDQVVLLKSEKTAEKLAELAGFTSDLQSPDGKATAYVCTNFSCSRPTADVQTLIRLIQEKE